MMRRVLASNAPIWLLTAALAGIAALLWLVAAGYSAVAAPVTVPWWLVAVGFVVTELLVAHVTFEDHSHTVSLSEVMLLVGLVFCAPADLLTAHLAGYAAVLLVVRRPPLIKTAFNLVNTTVEFALAIVVFHGVLGGAPVLSWRGWLASYAAALAAFAANTLGITAVISLSLRRFERSALLVAVGGASVLIVTTLGVLTVNIIWNDWRGLWLVGVGVGVAYAGLRAFVRLRNRYANLELLYKFTTSVSGATDTDDVLRLTLERSRDLMNAELAELLVSLPEGGWMAKRLVGTDITTEIDTTCDTDTLESLVLKMGGPVLARRTQRDAMLKAALADHGWHDMVASPFAREDGTKGALVVANHRGPVNSFETEDMKVLETFAGHTAIALRVGDLIDRLRTEAAEKEFSASHDALTGLANRKMLVDTLEARLPEASDEQLLAVLFMDLDRFKEVNDTLGHQTGDALLVEVARRLTQIVGDRATIARLGGDEFALVVPRITTPAEAVTMARTIEREIDRPFAIDQLSLEVHVSVGVAVAPVESNDPKTLFRHADIAMYAAKRRRSGVELYDRSIDHSSTRRLRLAGELRKTVDNQALTLAFQPQVSLSTGRVVALEALARWWHPSFGDISPEEFVPIAEQSGLIHQLTRWAIRASLIELVLWRRHDVHVHVAVNVSARNLIDSSLVNDVREILDDLDLPGDALTLEITESTLMDEPQRAVAILDRLRELGVRIAIDDFGTGYSSLSYLKRLAVDEVKIDKSFVGDMADDPELAAIVRSTIDLALNLNLRVVAEGVEDSRTARMLADLGCDVVQGYYFASPTRSHEVEHMVAEGLRPLRPCAAAEPGDACFLRPASSSASPTPLAALASSAPTR